MRFLVENAKSYAIFDFLIAYYLRRNHQNLVKVTQNYGPFQVNRAPPKKLRGGGTGNKTFIPFGWLAGWGFSITMTRIGLWEERIVFVGWRVVLLV